MKSVKNIKKSNHSNKTDGFLIQKSNLILYTRSTSIQMPLNSYFAVCYRLFINGAEWKFTPSDMIRFFEKCSPELLLTLMSIHKEFELHDGRIASVRLFERGMPPIPQSVYNMVALDFYDRMYVDYFNSLTYFPNRHVAEIPAEAVMP